MLTLSKYREYYQSYIIHVTGPLYNEPYQFITQGLSSKGRTSQINDIIQCFSYPFNQISMTCNIFLNRQYKLCFGA